MRRQDPGATTADLVRYASEATPVDVQPVFQDWLLTPGWYQRASRGESLEAMIASYRAPTDK